MDINIILPFVSRLMFQGSQFPNKGEEIFLSCQQHPDQGLM
jgi:hypothetical protein